MLLALLLAGCVPPGWSDTPVDGLVHAHRFRLGGGGADAVRVVCTHGASGEVHEVAGLPGDHLVVYGLLADESYDCVLSGPDGTEERAVQTGPLAADVPALEVTGETTGWTLFSTTRDDREGRAPRLLIVDAEGRVRWVHRVAENASDLDATWLGDGTVLLGGGYQVPPRRITLGGEVVHEARLSGEEPPHHHVEQRADGTVDVLRGAPASAGGVAWRGFRVETWDEALEERLWSWDAQRGVDDGWLPRANEGQDAYHANALIDRGGEVAVSLRHVSRIESIDRETGAHVWSLGRGGDFVLVDEAGEELPAALWFYGQHAPKMRGNRVLVHDNGWGRPTSRRFSRLVELALSEEAGTATVVWDWTEAGWYEPIWGDADWLPSGHVLLTRAHCERCGLGGLTQLVEIDPSTDEVVWRLTLTDPADGGYRAQRFVDCRWLGSSACVEAP